MAAGKQQKKHGPGRPFVPGDPRINRTIPGPGRPREEQRAWLRGWFDSEEGRAHLEKRLAKSDRVLIEMFRQAYGAAQQTVELTTVDLTRLTDDELAELRRLAERVASGARAGT